MITDAMKTLIERNTIALVATVTPEGRPAVSPKGTSVVLSEVQIAFSDIRSPGTARNLRHHSGVELNFIDVFLRQCCRLSGTATYLENGQARFQELLPRFGKWPTLAERMRGIVVVDIEKAQLLRSPIYDLGATEDELKAQWLRYYAEQHG